MKAAGKGLSHFRCYQHCKSAFDGTCCIIGPVITENSPFKLLMRSLHLCLRECPPTTCVDDQMLFQAISTSQDTSDAKTSEGAVDARATSCCTEAGHPKVPHTRWRARTLLSFPSVCSMPALGQQGANTAAHTTLQELSCFWLVTYKVCMATQPSHFPVASVQP